MKRHYLFLLFLLSVSQLAAQHVRELKIKPISPLFFNNYQVEFEWIPQKRIGVELKYRFERKNISFYDYSSGSVYPGYSTVDYVERLNTFAVAAKYYVSPITNGFGPFVGLFCLNQRYFKPSKVEQDYYKRAYKSELPKDLRTSFGVVAGLKIVYKDLLVLETEAGLGPNLYQVNVNQVLRDYYDYNSSYTAFADLKLGIRIPDKRKSKKK